MPPARLLQSSSRLASASLRRATTTTAFYRTAVAAAAVQTPRASRPATARSFSTSPLRPQAETIKAADVTPAPAVTPIEMTDSQYHDVADEYLEHVLLKFEEVQDQSDEVDVEFSSGVMTIRVPEKGTYVINKQPPNKQIWLSSPISGPKRYDWCTVGDGQADKEGTGAVRWTYLRDGSSLNQLILEELGMDLDTPIDG